MSELAGGFSRRAVAWMVGVAVASFAAAILLTAYGSELGDRPTAGANSWSYSALGQRALAELLRREGLGVTSRQTWGGAGPGPDRPLVLAEPASARSPGARERLARLAAEARDRGAPLVLVLPKWRGTPLPARPSWASAALRPTGEVERVLAALRVAALDGTTVHRTAGPAEFLHCTLRGAAGPPSRFTIEARPVQLLAPGPGLAAEVDCGAGLLVARGTLKPGGPALVVVADPDLWNNQGLGRADHAALAYRLFAERLGAKGVVFDETIHGFSRPRGLLAEAFRFPLLPSVLQGVLLLSLVLWAGMGWFGQPLPAAAGLPPGKAALIDNTAQLLAHGGQAADSLARYYQQSRRAVAARFFLPPDLPERELTQRLGELARRRGAALDLATLERRIARLVAGAEGGPRRGGRPAGTRSAALARRIYHWRMEMTDGNRKDP